MTFHIYIEGEPVECSLAVERGSVSCRKALSWDLNYPFATTELKLNLRDDFIDGERFKPLGGQRIRWQADDETKIVLVDGIIKNPGSGYEGMVNGAKLLKYGITVEDASYLFTKKLVPEDVYHFNQSYTPSMLMDNLVVFADPRISIANDNDVGMVINDVKLARKNIKDTLEEFLKGLGLFGWVDENWKFHHKNYATILNSLNDSKFNITDGSHYYKDLNLEDDFDNICTRIYCIGSQMDAGNFNAQNRKQGKQKRTDKILIKTATLEDINVVRSRLGFPALPEGTNPNLLTSDTPGIIEKDFPCQEIYDANALNEIAQSYIDMYSVPWVKGSVTYTTPGIVVGKSIVIDSESRQTQAVVPITEVNIETSNAGQDSAGNRKYAFKCSLTGPSKINKIRNMLKPPVEKSAKVERLIKPKYATFLTGKSTESVVSLNTSFEIVTRGEQNY